MDNHTVERKKSPNIVQSLSTPRQKQYKNPKTKKLKAVFFEHLFRAQAIQIDRRRRRKSEENVKTITWNKQQFLHICEVFIWAPILFCVPQITIGTSIFGSTHQRLLALLFGHPSMQTRTSPPPPHRATPKWNSIRMNKKWSQLWVLFAGLRRRFVLRNRRSFNWPRAHLVWRNWRASALRTNYKLYYCSLCICKTSDCFVWIEKRKDTRSDRYVLMQRISHLHLLFFFLFCCKRDQRATNIVIASASACVCVYKCPHLVSLFQVAFILAKNYNSNLILMPCGQWVSEWAANATK